MRAYLAAGWFSDAQEQRRLEVIDALRHAGIDFYSPKDEMLYIPGETSGIEVLNRNIKEIRSADFVIASTEGKDMGTVWEAGYAFAIGKPVVYYFLGRGKFNLMLAASGTAVCDTAKVLRTYLKAVKTHDCVIPMPHTGAME